MNTIFSLVVVVVLTIVTLLLQIVPNKKIPIQKKKSTTSSSSSSSTTSWNEVIERFKKCDMRKKILKTKLSEEYSYSFTPEFCPKSIRIANSRGLDFEERYEESLRKRDQRKKLNHKKNKNHSKSKMSKGSKKILKNVRPEELVRRNYTNQSKLTPPSFKPKINNFSSRRRTKELENYLKQPACKRLYLKEVKGDPFHQKPPPPPSKTSKTTSRTNSDGRSLARALYWKTKFWKTGRPYHPKRTAC